MNLRGIIIGIFLLSPLRLGAEWTCEDWIRAVAPHLYKPGRGEEEAPLQFGALPTSFRVSYFLNHPHYPRVPFVVGRDSHTRFLANWRLIGDRQLITLDFLFEKQVRGFSPHIRASLSRLYPKVLFLSSRLDVRGRVVSDVNFLEEAVLALTPSGIHYDRWIVEVSDPSLVGRLAESVESVTKKFFGGGMSEDEHRLHLLYQLGETYSESAGNLEEPSADKGWLLPKKKRGHVITEKGLVAERINPLSAADRIFIERDLVENPEPTLLFQGEALQILVASEWFKALLPPTLSGKNWTHRIHVQPAVHSQVSEGFSGLSFLLYFDFTDPMTRD